MREYLILFCRSVIAYFVLLFFTRVMGKKQMSQLTYFDYIVGITIGSIAAVASVDKDINVFEGSFSIIIWSILTILISQVTLKNIKIRLWLDGEPLVIINDGKVIYKNMKKARYNIGDLLMQLRDKDVFYITDVEMAVLEPDGKLSILKKAQKSTLTAEDMNIRKPKPGMMVDIVLNGNILSRHLQQINKDEQWVIKKLKSKNINNIKDVIFAGIQADQKMYVVTYDDSIEIDL
ncbi:hypothetical protein CLOBY_32570 [Clostridium saccharobutylicum]|uniref:DUF421 domain-containing protein n=1 Tax=Clostridium saccharobutylicum TaxID=169679 RepID=UPI000983ED44|nr:DUF421 domain-containing protein [Clostridium saccharobutylicum]AQS11103.1 hypothetical protein CLOBY_32570 [Clostridium saccharobutylicum]MBC2437558.1 DUF421 domain-containing protein [Clostridium saccharobutylicum]NSB89955.1 uncharacterized membrane protein YcaP (DUF421 family) [Clostridium saccharobutylicum]NYC32103.1 uncharacterized membrane protein YcaP (DUF421 family) [Clostridium saccharobutylicum]OOM14940.1 hypothetical protein CLSAB_30520 [Clostridium saccharobutylicum]